MKKYKYENIMVSRLFSGIRSAEHRDLIDKYAKEGYRYVGYIPTKSDSYGKLIEIDMIFETDED